MNLRDFSVTKPKLATITSLPFHYLQSSCNSILKTCAEINQIEVKPLRSYVTLLTFVPLKFYGSFVLYVVSSRWLGHFTWLAQKMLWMQEYHLSLVTHQYYSPLPHFFLWFCFIFLFSFFFSGFYTICRLYGLFPILLLSHCMYFLHKNVLQKVSKITTRHLGYYKLCDSIFVCIPKGVV
jgi:hypothetical protein